LTRFVKSVRPSRSHRFDTFCRICETFEVSQVVLLTLTAADKFVSLRAIKSFPRKRGSTCKTYDRFTLDPRFRGDDATGGGRMTRFKPGCVVVLILFMTIATVGTAHAQARKISLDAFIAETILNNPTVRGYIESHVVAAGEEYRSRGIDDVNFESLFQAAKKDQPQISGMGSTEDKSIAYEVGLSKIVSQTGTRLGAKYSDYWQRSAYPGEVTALFAPMNPYYTPSVTLALTQPLLKNIMGIQDQLDKRVSRIQLKLSEVQYQENIEAFISEITELFLGWLRAHKNAGTLENIYRKISEQEKLVRLQVKANVAESSDLYRVLEQKASYRAKWEGALASYEGYMREIAWMMNPDNPPGAIMPIMTGRSFLKKFASRADGEEYVREYSRLKKILVYTFDAQSQVVRARKNSRLPDLDLQVEYSRTGASGSFNKAHGSTFDNDDIAGGVNFSIPITDRAARGEYRAESARLKKIAFENERRMIDALSRLEALYKRERRINSQVKAYEEQVRFGKLKLDEEDDQFNDGRLTLFQLLEDQSTYINQKLMLESSRVDLASVRLMIGELTDVNLDAFRGVISEVVADNDKN